MFGQVTTIIIFSDDLTHIINTRAKLSLEFYHPCQSARAANGKDMNLLDTFVEVLVIVAAVSKKKIRLCTYQYLNILLLDIIHMRYIYM